MSAQVRTLLAGAIIAVSIATLALTGGALGVAEPWPILLVVGAGLLVGVPRLRHALALVSGISIGGVTAWAAATMLPDATVGRAAAAAVGVLFITVVTLATRGRLRFGMQLVGWAAMTALAGTTTSAATAAPRLTDLARSMVALLVASGLGLLVAQVAQLVGTGVVARGRNTAAVVVALTIGIVPLMVTAPAAAEHATDHVVGQRVIEHRQAIVRTHTADGAVTGGTVVTRLTVGAVTPSAGGAGNGGDQDVTVVLRDQAVQDLRSLSTLSGRGVPTVMGRTVTHTLSTSSASGTGASGTGDAVRTVAALERTVPIDVQVAIALNGVPVTPAGVVGRSGRLDITYTLINRTAEPRELRHFDGRGRPRTVTREVAVPFVGELIVLLDDRFTAVRSRDAAVTAIAPRAGGRSDVTELRGEVVLAEPVGATVRTITFTADVEDAVVPPASVRLTAVPMDATASGRVDADRAERVARALRDVADASGLVRTGLAALSVTDEGGVLASTATMLEVALATAVAAGADVNELRALVAAQDRRVDDGDGLVHGLLDAADVSGAGPMVVHTSAVYFLELSGRDADDAPGVLVRLALALLLLVAVGLLGRSVGTLTGTSATG